MSKYALTVTLVLRRSTLQQGLAHSVHEAGSPYPQAARDDN